MNRGGKMYWSNMNTDSLLQMFGVFIIIEVGCVVNG
jgi:hypothetical protein